MAKPIDHDREDFRFVYVSEARGGTFDFREKPKNAKDELIQYIDDGVQCIGTMWCATCVAIYIQVSSTRCFFAHINGFSAKSRGINHVNEEEGEVMRKAVYNKLVTEMEEKKWDTLDRKFGKSIVCCCPMTHTSSETGSKPLAGAYVIMGIRNFFDSIAEARLEEAGKHVAEARGLCGSTADSAEDVIEEAEKRLASEWDEETQESLEMVKDEAKWAIRLRKSSANLREMSNFDVGFERGFIIDQSSRIGVRVKNFEAMPHEYKLKKANKAPEDIGPWMYRTMENLPGSSWLICTSDDHDFLLHYAINKIEKINPSLDAKIVEHHLSAMVGYCEPESMSSSADDITEKLEVVDQRRTRSAERSTSKNKLWRKHEPPGYAVSDKSELEDCQSLDFTDEAQVRQGLRPRT